MVNGKGNWIEPAAAAPLIKSKRSVPDETPVVLPLLSTSENLDQVVTHASRHTRCTSHVQILVRVVVHRWWCVAFHMASPFSIHIVQML